MEPFKPAIRCREAAPEALQALSELHPVLRRIYASRQVTSDRELERSLGALPDYSDLLGIQDAVALLHRALSKQWRILIVADYDADGATSCALAVRGLQMMGAEHVDYLVPNRFEYGYGLTPEIVAVALNQHPDLIVTVDNGISSLAGVAAARKAGCHVLITDHHLPADSLPNADVIINPNQPDDGFQSKSLAGVGVMFYVLMALRAHLRDVGWFQSGEPNLAELLDLVALGTVADVVPLDDVNRKLVHQGILRIRAGRCRPGIKALLQVAKRDQVRLQASDLGFAVGPRLNAAGRLETMSLGIECLLTDHPHSALEMAQQLDELNLERRSLEAHMQDEAFAILKGWNNADRSSSAWGVCIYDPCWHQGVIGILASRIKERLHRPVIAFAESEPGQLKGSARSIEGLHIRDVLDDIAAKHPSVLSKFGGHAMAAGLSLAADDYETFCTLFDQAVRQRLNHRLPDKVFDVDGELTEDDFSLEFAHLLQGAGPWGQGFPEPAFVGDFHVVQVRVLQNKHLKFVLKQRPDGRFLDGIAFHVDRPESWLGKSPLRMVYRLDVNEYQGRVALQLMIDHLESIPD